MVGGMRRPLAALILLAAAGCFADGGPTVDGTASGSTGGTTLADVQPAICGDGAVEGSEECDEGPSNGAEGSSCRASCVRHACGDGIVAPGLEECDLGAFNGEGSACTATCAVEVCGDESVGPMESCDDGPVGSATCTGECRFVGCGDGVVSAPEECDDGNTVETDACTSLCRAARCGDGVVQDGVEGCDDGNLDPGDACTELCAPATCGDARVHRGVEECDDGNLSGGDQCSPVCSLAQLFVFATSIRYSGALGGLDGADAKCQALASKAGVQGTYRAWLSDGVETPATRFKHGLPYIRLDKKPVAQSLDAMIEAGVLQNPISLTENNEPLGDDQECGAINKVWTNLRRDATPIGELDCGGWTRVDGVAPQDGGIGVAHRTGQAWTDEQCALSCGSLLRLYCFQQMP